MQECAVSSYMYLLCQCYAIWKENYYYHLFPAEISLTLKNKKSILKSEKYAKPQNNTPTDFSTHIDKMIFTYFHKTVYNTYYWSAILYTSTIPIHHKTYLLLIYHLGIFHFRTRAVPSKISAFQMWRKIS